MQIRKALCILLTVTMIIGILPCVTYAADNKSRIIYFNDFESEDITGNASIAPKSNKIERYEEKNGNGAVMISTYGKSSEDAFFQATTKGIDWDNVVVELSLSCVEGGLSTNLQFKDSVPKQSALFSTDKNGNIISKGSETNLGSIQAGKWIKLSFAIDFANRKYSTYVNGKRVEKNITLNGECSKNFNFMRLYMTKGAQGDILLDNFAIYEGTEPRDITDEAAAMPTPAAAPTVSPKGSGKNYEINYADMGRLDNAVVLLVDAPNAYANKQLTKVDADNDAVVPTVINDRTLVPLRFISESFGAQVGWDEATQTATVVLDGKSVSAIIGSNALTVDGQSVPLDVPAQVINDRTMLPLRAMAESLGKTVFWDDRGLIILTDAATKIDSEKDARLISAMIAYLQSGKLALNYSASPHFTQWVLDDAVKAAPIEFSADKGNNNIASKGAKALYYLTLAAYLDETTAASDGTLAKDAALVQLRSLIGGGREPYACVGPYWSHAVVAASLVLVKNTPAVYGALTQDEKDRMDWLMKALAISGNWGFNDQNNYKTGFDLLGNFNKEWNPNYRNTYLNVVISAAMYFGADELDKIFTSFSYDEYMKKLEDLGYTNIIHTWSAAGKDLMENGGECTLLGGIGASGMVAGQSGGKGAGVKVPFKYKGMGPDDLDGIFTSLLDYTYGAVASSSHGVKDGEYYSYILSGKNTPYEGYNGMMFEFCSGSRSSAGYCYDSMMILMPVYANFKLFGGWNSEADWQKTFDAWIYVGTEDLIFKLTEGYMGYSTSFPGYKEEREYDKTSVGYAMDKDMWRNFHCMLGEDISVTVNPNAKPEINAAPAEPKDGITSPPADAIIPTYQTSKFTNDAVLPLGGSYTGDVTTEFDVVFDSEVGNTFDGVIMYDSADARDMTYAKANVLIQFNNQTINIMNGSGYKWTAFPVAANYRYHFKVKMNAATKKYSVWITPTWPEPGEEQLVADGYAFRNTAQEISAFGSLIPVRASQTGSYWIENHTVSAAE